MNRTTLHRRLGFLALGLGLLMAAPTNLAAWDFRSVSTASLDAYQDTAGGTPPEWGFTAGENVLIRLVGGTGWFLKAGVELNGRSAALAVAKANLGLSIPLATGWYASAGYQGTWYPPVAGYASTLSADINYEDDALWLTLAGNVGFGIDVLTTLWNLGSKYRFTPWLAAMAMATVGYDAANGWDAGGWGYLEVLPDPLRIRIGASAGSFHEASGFIKSGMDYSLLAQLVWQASDNVGLNLNGQWWFGDRIPARRSLGLAVSLQW